MSSLTPDLLSKVNSFPKLVNILRDHLDWPIGEDRELDEVIYDWDAAELGLKPEEVVKIREIKQLRPLVTNQPWGIFFISFDDKALSVTVLRRMLRGLVVKKRAIAGAAERQAWDKNDLVFAANFGASGQRELAFVHFSDGEDRGDLPVMKVLGWNARDTKLHNDYVGQTLETKFRWPDDQKDQKAWREQWSSAFELRLNETINTSKGLAMRLAGLASEIRARVNQLLEAEGEKGQMRIMLSAFRKNLIHDLDEDGFADMFAQTIAYGLLAARISRPAGIIADNLADMVPRTNPFLKELFASFLKIGGRDKRRGMDFDELGVRDVVDMLNAADMEAVKRDFGNRNPKKDPVIHFYEDFLFEYDRAQKVDAGIFYTPPAVVGFIVRGVDEMLRTEFGLPLGLADTSTWAEVVARNDRINIPAHVSPNAPFVQILDPATGTGTFLVEVIDLIHKRMEQHWKGQGKSTAEVKKAWNEYVPKHLLPRLTAFELKMAAYAIAHMKVGLKLSDTGYVFGSNERLHVLLTNSLQPARELDLEERMRLEAMAHEAERANIAKEKTPFTVVIGNPPYKGHSMNPSKDKKGKLTYAGELVQRFFKVRGVPLNERNPKWLNNDYVKFIGLALSVIEKSQHGVLGFITSNSWLDGATFRGVRTAVIDCFPCLRIVDLHGNVTKGERAPDGSKDEGVFQINEGTSITIAARVMVPATIKQHDLFGLLEAEIGEGKLAWLDSKSLREGIRTEIKPEPPYFELVPKDQTNASEFYALKSVRDLFPANSVGLATANDELTIHFTRSELEQLISVLLKLDFKQIDALREGKLKPDEWRVVFDVETGILTLKNTKEADDWQLRWAIEDIRNSKVPEHYFTLVRYRPFDDRWTFYSGNSGGFICRPRSEVLRHLLDEQNIALLTSRMTKGETFGHVLVCDHPSEVIGLSSKTSNNAYSFPLWLMPTADEKARHPNIDRSLALLFGNAANLTYQDGIPAGEQQSFGDDYRRIKPQQVSLLDTSWDGRGDLTKSFGPHDLFDYIYAILHAPSYRSRYVEFLKSDFPRIPTPGSRDIFQKLVKLGSELVALHLLKPEEATILQKPDITFHGQGEPRVAKGFPKYDRGKVMINASRWFEDVSEATWNFHVGGYQVLDKWLADRAETGGKKPKPGRILTDDDILHYRRVVVALTETRRIMAEIDKVIETHGGWPKAFGGPNGETV